MQPVPAHGDGAFFFAATEGGPTESGQIWRLDPVGPDGGRLTLVAQEEGEGLFINPDNLTVAPFGGLVIAEDNDGPNHLHWVRPNGEVTPLARNAFEGGVSEFCGVCFSPDGKVMFANLQEPGFTLAAVSGPFDRLRADSPDDSGC